MRRIKSVAMSLILVGVVLAGCTGGNDGTGPGTAAPPQAVVTASPLSPTVGETVTFRASQAQDGDTAEWSFGDGENGTGTQTTHAYEAPGQYIVLLNLTNGRGQSATNDASLTYITVVPEAIELANITAETAPVARAAASAHVIQVGGTVSFDATGSGSWAANPDFDPTDSVQSPTHNPPFESTGEVTYSWDFGDGSAPGSEPKVNHTFSEAGLFPVKLTVTSPGGQTGEYVVTIRALPNVPPRTGVPNPGVFLTVTISEPESLDPGYDYETAGGAILENVYEKLFDYPRDAADRVVPRLAAAEPEIDASGMNWTVKIRPNVKFHDGTALTAEDVKFSLDRLILMNDPDGPAWIYGVIAGAEHYMHESDGTAEDRAAYLAAGGVTVVDDQTVKFRLDFPDPAFKFKLAFYASSIVSKDYVCANSEPDFVDCLPPPGETRHPWMDTHTAGTGPFMLDAWIPGQQVILKRFDGYWNEEGKAKVEKVIIQRVDDINTRLLMGFSGQADDIYVPVDHDVDVIGKPGLRIVENPSWTVGFIGYNQKFCGGPEDSGFQTCMTANSGDAPKDASGQPAPLFFSDINMRKAFTWAFDYQTYFDQILKGHGRMLNGPLPKGIFGYDESIPAETQDMAKAVEAFKLTNYSEGFSITVYYNTGNTVREKTAALFAQNLEEMCRQAGATCDVKSQGLDWSTAFLPKQRARALPMFYLGWAPDYAYPDNYVVTFAHSEKGIYSKRTGYANPELDAKLDLLVQELDETKSKQGWSEAVKMLNADYAFLWLGQSANYHVERDWVKGYYYNPMHSGGPNVGDYSAVSKG